MSAAGKHGSRSVKLLEGLENTYLGIFHERSALKAFYCHVSSKVTSSIDSIYQEPKRMLLAPAMLLLMLEGIVEGITLTMTCAVQAQLDTICAQVVHEFRKFELDQNRPYACFTVTKLKMEVRFITTQDKSLIRVGEVVDCG